MQESPPSANGFARWSLWSVPAPALALILTVELLALVTLVVGIRHGLGDVTGQWPWIVGVLAVSGIVSTEASLGIERRRRPAGDSPHIDLSSVWTFAAAALLPGVLASAVAALIYTHLSLRCWRGSGVPPHRAVFSAATVVLAVQTAAAVIGGVPPPDRFATPFGIAAVVLALLAHAAVNMVLVIAVIVLSRPSRSASTFLQLLRRPDDAALEFATLSMGALIAAATTAFGPVYAVLVLPALLVLHRTVLVRQLEEAASTDSKTGLLNAAAWHLRAGRALRRRGRAESSATVLVLDLDHFKQVNDRHGHLVGDQVLAAVASAVRAEVRDDDVVGRFGGEEFVVLLAGLDAEADRAAAEAVAERIRRRISELHVEIGGGHGGPVVDDLTVSIGGATLPADGTELSELLQAADTAMYAAKRAGRNRVRMGVRHVMGTATTAPTATAPTATAPTATAPTATAPAAPAPATTAPVHRPTPYRRS